MKATIGSPECCASEGGDCGGMIRLRSGKRPNEEYFLRSASRFYPRKTGSWQEYCEYLPDFLRRLGVGWGYTRGRTGCKGWMLADNATHHRTIDGHLALLVPLEEYWLIRCSFTQLEKKPKKLIFAVSVKEARMGSRRDGRNKD